MSIEIRVPDLGGAEDVEIIEVLVSVGDKVDVDAPLITVESDKASMDVPSPQAGTISSIEIKLGDKLNVDDLIALLEADDKAQEEDNASAAAAEECSGGV